MSFSRAILEIDLKKIADNYQALRNLCMAAELAIALKANAYGLGADKVAPIIERAGCRNFFVARLDEGIDLRKVVSNANIYVLDGMFAGEEKIFVKHKMIPILNHLDQIENWQKFNSKHNLPYGLHTDTGMHRLGIPPEEWEQLISNDYVMHKYPPALVMSHLCAGENSSCLQSQKQLTIFDKIRKFFPHSKISLANSSGIFLGKAYHFDMARVGIALYGVTDNQEINLQNPISLFAPIIQLKTLKADNTIGYNMTFTTKRDSIIATLPIGYADGYSRAFSNKGRVYINGHYADVVGNVSMDLITIDVTHIPNLRLGMLAEIIGPHCSPQYVASQVGIIGYEILTNLGKRYKRVYKY